ncbi:MAG: peptidyl-prolyl cis-trans isomerase SurA [Campylobacterota bacterium]|nr:peptidyl-prolyl cis-trans isomerase SurA [Campylobacterota bacterium]
MRILIVCFVFILSLEAGLVNAVSFIVNNTPITLYQIDKIAEKMNISKEKALEFLIDEKIKEDEIKTLGIFVDEFEIEDRMEAIAKSNNLSKKELVDILESKFISLKEYKEELKKKIMQEKLIRKIFSQESIFVDDEDALIYYKNNPQNFTLPAKVKITKYATKNKRELENFLANPLIINQAIVTESEVVDTSALNPSLASLVAETKEGAFTPILPTGNDIFVAIFVEEKLDMVQKEFNDVKNTIVDKLREESESKAIDRYFKKQRSMAKIITLRVP